ncbi:polyprenyl synthetase family protein [Chloroflexota bacterium]
MIFTKYNPEIEWELKEIIGDDSSAFYQMMRYHLGWVDEKGNSQDAKTGKMLRSTLCLTSCRAVGGDWEKALPAAAVLELIHNFSLVHDDIEDLSDFRRHRRTVWNIWGQAQAINVGDGMYALSRLAILRLTNNGFPDNKVLSIIGLLDKACVKLCEGQYSDMCFESRYDVSVEEYLLMINRKTANLISCSIKAGALLGTDDERIVNELEQFGLLLGMAFQIQDDILGIWGTEDKTGKSMSDILQRKKSLPIVHGLTSASSKSAETIRRIYDKEIIDEVDVATVTNVLNKAGAKYYCRNLANEYYDKAVSILDNLELDKQAQSDLTEIADFFIKRDF